MIEEDSITIDEFIKATEDALKEFRAMWTSKTNKEEYPIKMGMTEWEEHFDISR